MLPSIIAIKQKRSHSVYPLLQSVVQCTATKRTKNFSLLFYSLFTGSNNQWASESILVVLQIFICFFIWLLQNTLFFYPWCWAHHNMGLLSYIMLLLFDFAFLHNAPHLAANPTQAATSAAHLQQQSYSLSWYTPTCLTWQPVWHHLCHWIHQPSQAVTSAAGSERTHLSSSCNSSLYPLCLLHYFI